MGDANELPIVTRANKLREALEGCLAAMLMMHDQANGDGDLDATVSLWNASMDLANRTLDEDDAKWGQATPPRSRAMTPGPARGRT